MSTKALAGPLGCIMRAPQQLVASLFYFSHFARPKKLSCQSQPLRFGFCPRAGAGSGGRGEAPVASPKRIPTGRMSSRVGLAASKLNVCHSESHRRRVRVRNAPLLRPIGGRWPAGWKPSVIVEYWRARSVRFRRRHASAVGRTRNVGHWRLTGASAETVEWRPGLCAVRVRGPLTGRTTERPPVERAAAI